MSIVVYGIRNCGTMKKAFSWLDAQGLHYDFHDYKKSGVPLADLQAWARRWGWEALINRRGTTWRRLPEAERSIADAEGALNLLVTYPSMIRRPVLIAGETGLLGFDAEEWMKAIKSPESNAPPSD